MTAARDEILLRVRTALGDARVAPPPTRAYDRELPPGTNVVSLFAERAADYRATITRVTPEGLAAAIASALRARGVTRLVTPAGIPDAWLSESTVERLQDEPRLSVAQLDGADAVLTGATVAIALTGTIVLDGRPGQGRRVLSLLPDVHLCVVGADQVVGTVPQAIARLDPLRAQTWISGPSATSDIELNRVEGVHGPRTLHVLICEPGPPP
jgi:L-lactate dehydrogenase complex protein LldG